MIKAWLLRLWMHFQNFVGGPLFALMHIKRPPKIPPITNPLLKASATVLAAKIRNREITSEEVVRAYIDRIKEVNPFVNAVIEDRFEDALNDARDCDANLKSGKLDMIKLEKEKPLYGLPVTIKESLSVKGMSCTGGNIVFKGTKATENGDMVKSVLEAGAIPLCVTNTSEFCCSIHSSNVLFGYTKNPFDLRRSPGGSSGGEGALLGSGSSLLGFGSDLLGSIRIPSLFNGVFGHKPSPGIISNVGHFPSSKDTTFLKFLVTGPMARNVDDLMLAMKAITAKCEIPLRLDEPVDLKSLKVYYLESIDSIFGTHAASTEMREKVRDAVRHLKKQGAHVEELSQKYVSNMFNFLMCMFGELDMPDPLKDIGRETTASNFLCLIEYWKALLGLSNYSAQLSLLQMIVNSRGYVSKTDIDVYKRKREETTEQLHELLGKDAIIIMPTFVQPAGYPPEVVLQTDSSIYCGFSNLLQLAATHIPAGLNGKGLPVGFQVVAGPQQDRLCLAVAKEFEKHFGGWVPPPS